MSIWGCSSAGRAPALHAGGQGFESPQLHHVLLGTNSGVFPVICPSLMGQKSGNNNHVNNSYLKQEESEAP